MGSHRVGDSYKAPLEETGKGSASESSTKKKGRTVAITTKDMQKRRNDVKARTTLLLALPDEYQLRFSKLQAIVSHLEFMDVEIEQDNLNQKFLTSLTPEWLMYTIVWRNRDDLDTMCLDDVYNHLKVYESEVQKKSESNSQNMAFISSSNTSSGKAASPSHDTICAYIATQSNGSQIKYEDITQIDEDDIEEMDIKWNMALLSMRADRFWKKTGKKITIQGSDVAGFDKSIVECFNCHKMGHFARECIAPRSQDRGKRESYKQATDEVPTEFALMAKSSSSSNNEVYDDSYCSKSCRKTTKSLNTKISKLNEELSDCKIDLYNYKRGLSQVEARLVEFKENKVKYCERIRVLERDVEIRDNKIEYLKNELEQIKKEKESLDNKLTGFENASKDLDNLLGSQRSDKNKEGLGYSAVPPHPAQIYSPPKKDLSWTGLPEFVDDTVIDYRRPTPSIDASKCNKVNSKVIIFLFLSMENQQGNPQNNIDEEAPRAWYGTLSKYLLDNGFQRGTIDQTLFIRKHKGEFLLVQVYVDDIIFGSSNPQLCREFEALMHDKFQMRAMGELTFFLGLQVLQKKDGIFVLQDKMLVIFSKSLDTQMLGQLILPWTKRILGEKMDL
nr:putative ribonuclease H-like domain-containing protein [Tanacetum cinerariifolium]